jgi:hypothetical protein
MVPGEGDSYLASDAFVQLTWASCNVGVYPHKVTISLWQNATQQIAVLASNIDDVGMRVYLIFRLVSTL